MVLNKVEQKDLVKELLTTLFTAEELKHFIQFKYDEKVSVQVPWNRAFSHVAGEVVLLLNRRGLIDRRFFELLRKERPRLSGKIDFVEKFVLQSASTASQSGYLMIVASAEEERAGIFGIAEVGSYVFHLGTSGVASIMHNLQLDEVAFLAGLSGLVLTGGVFLSRARNKIHERAMLCLRASGGESYQPSSELTQRNRLRVLEYTALLGLLAAALTACYEVFSPCCELTLTAKRTGIAAVMFLWGFLAFQAARRPVLKTAESALKRLGKLGVLSIIIGFLVYSVKCTDIADDFNMTLWYSVPRERQCSTGTERCIEPTRSCNSIETQCAMLLNGGNILLWAGLPRAAFVLGKRCHELLPTSESLELMVKASCAMEDRESAEELILQSPNRWQSDLRNVCHQHLPLRRRVLR